ncbi:MAG: c-type cytochrome [Acidobacteriota bacterium]|nr:MAG: c-type cytochrome [Acidobacteriota bacterium]
MKNEIRLFPLILAAGLVLVAVGMFITVFFSNEIFPEYSPAHRGELVAMEAGCFSCHGTVDGLASPNPVPSTPLDGFRPVHSMFEDRQPLDELSQWIENGISDRRAASPEYLERRSRKTLKMPGYKQSLNPFELQDLKAYVALMQYRRSSREKGSEHRGEQLARQLACFTCHGELGQGGIENPASLKGYIPGFFGTDFRALTQNGDREDLRQWILDGRSEFFWNQGFAGFYPGQYFTERQAIQMPAYRDRISDEDLEILVDYLIELMELGPLDAEGLFKYRPVNPDR